MYTLQLSAGLIGFVASLVAFWIYNRDGSKISTGTWLTLVIGDTLDLASYAGMTETWWKDLVPLSFAIGSFITFWYALARKRFDWPDRFDWSVVVCDTAITLWWLLHATATEANLLYQSTTLIAFLPMYRGLLNGTEREHPFPWLLWVLSFACFLFSVSIELEKWEDTMFPIVGLVTHFLVYWLAKRKA